MKITITENEGLLTALLEGELDTAAAQETGNAFQPLMEAKDRHIIIDCTQLNYISSSGLRLFLSLQKSCKSNGNHLTLKHLNANIQNVFGMTGLSSLFDIQ